MPTPPKPTKGGEDLAEVERALSVLQGRHPEHERARREDEAARAKRAAELEAQAKVASREMLRKRALYGGIGVFVVLATVSGGLAFRHEVSRRGAIEQATDPYRAMGFVITDTSSRSEPNKLETKTEGAGCYLAVTTQAAQSIPLEVTAGDAKVSGKGPVLACTCEGGKLTVKGDVPEGAGLAVLRIDAAAIGGSRAAAFLPFKPGTVADTDEACADASLDAWIDAKRAPKATAQEAWLADPKRAPLVRTGFKMVATVKAEVPFAVVEVPGQSCILASSANEADRMALRARGGTHVLAPSTGPIGYCTQNDATLLLQRSAPSTGEISVATVPAAKVGGLSGLRDIARIVGSPLAAEAIAPSDRAWSAKQALVVASVPEQLVNIASTPDIPPDADARLVALSFATPNALTSESPDGVFSYCEPPLDAKTVDSLCAFSGPQFWHLGSKDAVAGIARAKLPFWLFALEGVSDPVALKVETQMVSLSKKLRYEGFEPTTLEAITEVEKGADILGRSGEDAVVAVALAPVAPFAFPLTDGPAWTLDEAPRVVAVKPLEKVLLVSTEKKLPPAKDKRRTVVYRRQAAR